MTVDAPPALPPVPLVHTDSLLDPRKVIHETKRTHVYMTRFSKPEHGAPMDADVVVKRFKMCDEEALNRFEAEAALLTKLSEGSVHVVRPIAKIVQPPTYSIVLPFFPHGSMSEVIHSPTSCAVAWPLKLLFIRDLVAAVVDSHEQDVIIRDVKPANMLVGEDLVARLADLELAKTVDEINAPRQENYGGPSSRRKTRFEGTPEYMAPELLRAPGSQLQRGVVRATKATDVYSIGISVIEIATGQVPYTDVETTTEQLHTVVETRYTPTALNNAIIEEGLRPNLPEPGACPPSIVDIAKRCWDHDPAARPSATKVLQVIDAELAKQGISLETNRLPFYTELKVSSQEGSSASSPVDANSPRMSPVADWPEVLRDLAVSPPDGRVGRLPALVRGNAEGTAGRREFMEDAWFCVEWYSHARTGAWCFGMLDGHGGSGCAHFVRNNLPSAIEASILATPADIKGALVRAFSDVEGRWAKEAAQAEDRSGTCATVAVILGGHLWVAWVGDCTAVLCRDGKALSLTTDHNPAMPSERRRVEEEGGTVSMTADGKYRVAGRVAVTRSFGDGLFFKGVTAVPEVAHYPLSGLDEFLVVASDGVWDVLTPAIVVTNLQNTVRHEDYGAKRIVSDAYNNESTDNIGAVVVYLSDKEYKGDPLPMHTD